VPDPSVDTPIAARPAERADHAVPNAALDQTKRTLDATQGLVGEPSDAERARTIVAGGRTAALSTIAADSGGVPFGSLVAHAVDELGRPLLCLSDLAEHSRNLTADPRASIMVTEPSDNTGDTEGDPLARGRVTLLGEVTVLAGAEREAALARYRSVHTDAFYVEFSDFRLYRLEVASARFVGGFGRMSWVAAADYARAEPDPLRPHRAGIVDHMNNDHAEALVAFCRVLAGRPDTATARMVDVDRYGFSVLAGDSPDGDLKALRFGFDTPTDTMLGVRTAMVELVRRTRA
jgi:hypothetical protein